MPTKLGYKPAVTLAQIKKSQLFLHNVAKANAIGVSKHAFAQMLQEGVTNSVNETGELYLGKNLASAFRWLDTGNLHFYSCIRMDEPRECLVTTYTLHGVAYPLSKFLRKKHGTK